MSVVEAQKKIVELQSQLVDLQAKLASHGEQLGNANLSEADADEALIAYLDLGQKAFNGAAELIDSVLQSVSDFLSGIGDSEDEPAS